LTFHTFDGPQLNIFLIRHAETAWSLSGQHTGRTELPLTIHGEETALDLKPFLAQMSFTQVLTSPRLRARKTCELAGLSDQSEIEPDLAEWNYGYYEGLRSVEIRHTRLDWSIWRHGCPGGESPGLASDRADRLISRLCRFTGNLALFSHGQFSRVLAARWLGLPSREGRHFAMDPASVSILGYENNHSNQRVISLWNAMPNSLAESDNFA
jgi:broad specificity phosphatase PhoE